jgi:adenylate cyclase
MQPVVTPSPLLSSDHDLFKQLSPAISYHLRKLLRQNYDRLTGHVSDEQHPDEKSRSTLSASQVLAQGNSKIGSEPKQFVEQLENLVIEHQKLGHQGAKYRQDLQKTEQTIFELLGFTIPDIATTSTILIIDDTPENLRLLSSALTQQGYAVRNAINGPLALSRAQAIRPDLILLDVTMPGMDGYEVCRRMKDDIQTRDIPIIFISALDSAIDKVKAFSVGGVDYITKPFQIEEVLARIEHQLRIWNLQRRLEDQNIRLEQEIKDRQASEERYQNLFHNATEGLFRSTPDGHFISANQTLCTILGYENLTQLNREVENIAKIYVEPGRRSAFLTRLKEHDRVESFESQVRRRDGEAVWVSETVRTIRGSGGELVCYEGSITDITEGKTGGVDRQKRRQQMRQLLLSLFPKTIAKQIIRKGHSPIEQSGIGVALWIDLGPLMQVWLNQPSSNFVQGINQVLSRCEQLAEGYDIEHTRLMGNTYLAVIGVPTSKPEPAIRLANLALSIQQVMRQLPPGLNDPILMRMGMQEGALVAGVVGDRRLSYEVWGAAVNGAQQLCEESLSGKIQVSEGVATALRLSHRIEESRKTGAFEIRSKTMYWLEGRR